MIRCQNLHNKTFWQANNEEKHPKGTNSLENMWFKHSGLWPLTSCQSSQGHIKRGCALFPKMMFSTAKFWESKGAPSAAVAVSVRVLGCGAAVACPMRRHGSRALLCSGELHPTPFTSYKGRLQNCVMETELLVWEGQMGVGSLELISYALFKPITEELAQMGSRQI